MGATGPQTLLNAATYSRTGTAAKFELRNDRGAYASDDTGTDSLRYNWLTGGTPSNYEVQATLVSGTFTSGTTGSWLNLGTTRTWTRGATVGNFQTVTATFEIRDATSLVVLASANITLECDNT